MTDATADFFGGLAERGSEPILQNVTGTIRFDLMRGKKAEHWLVTIKKGDVTVSRENVDADSVVRIDKALFDQIASGEANTMASLLRGAVSGEGDLELAIRFERLFPGPPSSSDQRRAAGYARRAS
jgi:hypothetical protein